MTVNRKVSLSIDVGGGSIRIEETDDLTQKGIQKAYDHKSKIKITVSEEPFQPGQTGSLSTVSVTKEQLSELMDACRQLCIPAGPIPRHDRKQYVEQAAG